MADALHSYLAWWQFFVIAALLWLLYTGLKRFKTYVFHATSLHTLHLPNIVLVILFILSFVLVNPIIHGFIMIIGVVLFYPVISSYLRGIIVFNNSKLLTGDLIKVADKEGRISDISLSGIKLLTGSNNIYIPFSKLSGDIIEKYQSDQTLYLSFVCKPKDEEEKLSSSVLEKLIFNFPFLEHRSDIEILQLNNSFRVNLSLANDRFRTSLRKQIEEAGYTFELSKNN